MLLFWCLALLMIVVALFIVLRHLVFPHKFNTERGEKLTLTIFEERLLELEHERSDGLISDEQLHAAKLEMEHDLLDEVNTAELSPEAGSMSVHKTPDWIGALTIFVLVPAIAIPVYYSIGEPRIVTALQETPQQAMQEQLASVDEMLERLEEKMKQNPEERQGWQMLGRSYVSLGRYEQAVTAYEKLHALAGDDPEVLIPFASALSMATGDFRGKPETLIAKALEIQPNNEAGLWMAGFLEYQRQDFTKAVDYWNRLLPLVQADPNAAAELEKMIAQARSSISVEQQDTVNETDSNSPLPAPAVKSISVSISLAPELLEKVVLSDTLFIFARAVEGPPAPLAAVKKQVKELPLEITLDDSMAMMPALKLSYFENVLVSARISKSGDPGSSSGDMEAKSVEAVPGQEGVIKLIIDSVVP